MKRTNMKIQLRLKSLTMRQLSHVRGGDTILPAISQAVCRPTEIYACTGGHTICVEVVRTTASC